MGEVGTAAILGTLSEMEEEAAASLTGVPKGRRSRKKGLKADLEKQSKNMKKEKMSRVAVGWHRPETRGSR